MKPSKAKKQQQQQNQPQMIQTILNRFVFSVSLSSSLFYFFLRFITRKKGVEV
jgi:cell division protein FtsB